MTNDPALAAALTTALPVDPAALGRLHERLAADASADGVLDLAYRDLDTPIGSLLLVATETGLVRIAFAAEDHASVLQALADRISPRILRAPGRLDDAARQLDEYFAGQRKEFDLALDWRLSAGFRREVLHHLAEIAYGRTETYATVAVRSGRPKAVRAVGTACATNPLPVVIPCHRVVRTDGGMGGYLGGLDAKAALLAMEAAA
jgi:methylated-DNA-[protein]-cysteine S-methyltransferase